MNEADPNIKLSVEMEQNNQLPFLDVLVHHGDTTPRFAWYHKTTWSGQYLHFASFVPREWKKSLLKGLKFRLVSICSDEFLEDAMHEVRDALFNSGYPHEFVKEYVDDYTGSVGRKRIDVPRKQIFIKLPFLGDWQSKRIAHKLNAAVQAAYPMAKVTPRYTTIRAITRTSLQMAGHMEQGGVVYRFQCKCDRQQSYVGRTEKRLKERARQHIPKWLENGAKKRPRSTLPPSSAIARHLLKCGMPVVMDECFSIIHKGFAAHTNRILEALEIKDRNPVLCSQKEFVYELNLPW